jgi:predicted phosphoribosyltransferase
MDRSPLYADRRDAGRKLAAALAGRAVDNPVVYALPRGGAPVAFEIARALRAPMDLILARKIGAPGDPELALGAIAEGEGIEPVINERVRMGLGCDPAYIQRATAEALEEIGRRRRAYMRGRAGTDPKGRTAILVDDGIATGATTLAAIRSLKARGAARVVLATPVAPPETVAALRLEADEVVCLAQPPDFYGISQFYRDFHQLSDAEVIRLLDQAQDGQADSLSDP